MDKATLSLGHVMKWETGGPDGPLAAGYRGKHPASQSKQGSQASLQGFPLTVDHPSFLIKKRKRKGFSRYVGPVDTGDYEVVPMLIHADNLQRTNALISRVHPENTMYFSDLIGNQPVDNRGHKAQGGILPPGPRNLLVPC